MHASHSPRTVQNGLLRFFVGGSIDAGKSTLIGRLVHEASVTAKGELASLAQDPARCGGVDPQQTGFAHPGDGLDDARARGITIDVARRYFATPRRKFAVADISSHRSNTLSTVNGAFTCDVAVIVVDARRGIVPQTRLHMAIAHLVGIRHLVVAVNKLDLVLWDRGIYERTVVAFRDFAQQIEIAAAVAIPVSALNGDNLAGRSANTPWYEGPSLLGHLESVDAESEQSGKPLRVLVQTGPLPDAVAGLCAGAVVAGTLRRGDAVQIVPAGVTCRVDRIVVAGVDREWAEAGTLVAFGLDRRADLACGDILAAPDQPAQVTDQFEAHLIWNGEQPLLPGRDYTLRIGARSVAASVTAIKCRLNVETWRREPARTLRLNDIGICDIATALPIAVDSFAEMRRTGCFILTDRSSCKIVGAGIVDYPLRRGMNVKEQPLALAKRARAALKAQKPCVVWFTGLSGAGKSTIANLVEASLAASGRHTYLLDGDNIRRGLNKDIGFTDVDRVENIRRVAEVAKLFVDAGLIVLCSFISPFQAERAAIRDMLGRDEYFEIFVSAPLAVCEARDPKGLYAKARNGLLPSFTGIDSPYEPPQNPDLLLDTTISTAQVLANRVMDLLSSRGVIGTDEAPPL